MTGSGISASYAVSPAQMLTSEPVSSSEDISDTAEPQHHSEPSGDSTNPPSPPSEIVLEATSGLSRIITGEKRPAETDLVGYALERSQRARLSVERQQHTQEFAQRPLQEQLISLYVKIQQLLPERAIATRPVWSLPPPILKFIEDEAHVILVSPTVYNYVQHDWPLNKLMARLAEQAQWNIAGLHADHEKWSVVRKTAELEVYRQRGEIKAAIAMTRVSRRDIISLSHVINRNHETCEQGSTQTLQIPGIMRMAFIRYCYTGFHKASLNGSVSPYNQSQNWDSFWEYVDRTLNKVRSDANDNPVEIVHAFKHILNIDQAVYGSVDLSQMDT